MDVTIDLNTIPEESSLVDQGLDVYKRQGKGMDKSTIASRLKLQPFVVGKIMLQAKTFTKEQILSYVNLLSLIHI